jgi:hypothetical protein
MCRPSTWHFTLSSYPTTMPERYAPTLHIQRGNQGPGSSRKNRDPGVLHLDSRPGPHPWLCNDLGMNLLLHSLSPRIGLGASPVQHPPPVRHPQCCSSSTVSASAQGPKAYRPCSTNSKATNTLPSSLCTGHLGCCCWLPQSLHTSASELLGCHFVGAYYAPSLLFYPSNSQDVRVTSWPFPNQSCLFFVLLFWQYWGLS